MEAEEATGITPSPAPSSSNPQFQSTLDRSFDSPWFEIYKRGSFLLQPKKRREAECASDTTLMSNEATVIPYPVLDLLYFQKLTGKSRVVLSISKLLQSQKNTAINSQ